LILKLIYLCYSPEDQAFLEAEYKRNPKPDKPARMEIVRHVALGEKEVQVRVISSIFLASYLEITRFISWEHRDC
jgi:hypothetical protein